MNFLESIGLSPAALATWPWQEIVIWTVSALCFLIIMTFAIRGFPRGGRPKFR